jgi:cytochrome c oxidase assembly protein Cox11
MNVLACFFAVVNFSLFPLLSTAVYSLKMPKRTCKFRDDLQKKNLCFCSNHNELKGECKICLLGIFVSVAKKGLLDLQAHME